MSRTAAEVLTGRELGVAYRSMAVSLDHEPLSRTLPLTVRRYARIARRAAIAEEVHPDSPDPPACSVCGRVRSCLAV